LLAILALLLVYILLVVSLFKRYDHPHCNDVKHWDVSSEEIADTESKSKRNQLSQ